MDSCLSSTDPSGQSLLPSGPDGRKRRVSYFYEPTIGNYYFGQDHPMKPLRVSMAHDLIVNYSLHRHMTINHPLPVGRSEMERFHTDDYIGFLSSVSPEILQDHRHDQRLERFNMVGDCPVFHGLYQFCQATAGGSIGAAVMLNQGDADIAINWAGGFHHAQKSKASGFCYVNDVVLGILGLLKVHRRVLYIDIDVHHVDAVEEAFYLTDRVMTVSFHKFGLFPGSGNIVDIGANRGKYYSLNVPLKDGVDDESLRSVFRPVILKAMDVYKPDAVVLQCGADSLAGDRLGCFNITIDGHAYCLRFLRSFNVPLMVLGGGGYTLRNVARCWCYETAVAIGVELDNQLPHNKYYEYFGPDYTLHIQPTRRENLNSARYLESTRNRLLEQLSKVSHAPSVPFQTAPPTAESSEESGEVVDDRPRPRIWDGDSF